MLKYSRNRQCTADITFGDIYEHEPCRSLVDRYAHLHTISYIYNTISIYLMQSAALVYCTIF